MDASGLGARESQWYKQLLKHYDEQQYKKVLRLAGDILEQAPEHAETLSMKALALQQTGGDGAEILALAKAGLRHNVRSGTCWHALALIHRGNRNFEEAAKCFQQAQKLQPKHNAVLRDLAALQLQLGHLEGHLASRRLLLLGAPAAKVHWTGYVVAQAMRGEFAWAAEVLRLARNKFSLVLARATAQMRDLQRLDGDQQLKVVHYHESFAAAAITPAAKQDLAALIEDEIETSESIMWEAQLLERAGRLDDVLRALNDPANYPFIKDYLGRWLQLARVHLAKGSLDKAHTCYRSLFRQQPQNRTFATLFLATSPPLRSKVSFTPFSDSLASGEDCFLAVSNYGLLSPAVPTANVDGWPVPPLAHIFPEFSKDYSRPTPHQARFLLVRDLTEAEEAFFAGWVRQEVEAAESQTSPVLLRQLVDLCCDKVRVRFYLDWLMRPFALRGSAACCELVKMVLIQGTKPDARDSEIMKRDLVVDLLQEWVESAAEGKISPLSPLPPEWLDNSPHPLASVVEEFSRTQLPAAAAALLCYLRVNLAQALTHCGRDDEALRIATEAVQSIPTCVEAHMCQARCLKRLGKISDAAVVMARARELDLQDRFLNAKTIKYFFQAKRYEEACQISTFFLASENPAESQNFGFQLRKARCLLELGREDEALETCYETLSACQEIANDLFDFHNYAFRKGNMRSYMLCLELKHRVWCSKHALAATAMVLGILRRRRNEAEPENNSSSNKATDDTGGKETKESKNGCAFYGEAAQQEMLRLLRLIAPASEFSPEANELLFQSAADLGLDALQIRAANRLAFLRGNDKELQGLCKARCLPADKIIASVASSF